MLFRVVSGVGLGRGILDFGGDVKWEGAVWRVNLRRPIVTMVTLLHRCVEVCKAIELSFGVVSGAGPGIHALDGSPRASREKSCFWHGFGIFRKFVSIDFNGVMAY